jgi:uncharacterized phiE125 gp8 family phage protein
MQTLITGAQVDQETLVSIADCKAHMRVTHAHEDTLIGLLRNAAVSYVEQNCDTKLGSYTAQVYLPQFRSFWFTIGPVSAIASVEYQATIDDTAWSTLSTTLWYKDIRQAPDRMAFRDTPTLYPYALAPVRVNCTLGYATLPPDMVAAIKLLVAHLYENRQEEITGAMTSRLKLGIDALLAPYRTLT